MQTPSHRRAYVLATAPIVAALLFGCQKSLPSAPSDVTTGITVYEDSNYSGGSAHLTADVADFEDYSGPCVHHEQISGPSGNPITTTVTNWGDCISSLRVAPGWRATIFKDDGFRGESMEITSDQPDLKRVVGSCSSGGMNDCISSIRVQRN